MANIYFEKRKQRLNQKINLLINRLDFKKDVSELRTKWNIPQEGLKTEIEIENWNNQILDDTDNYYNKNWPNEVTKIIRLRGQKKYSEADQIKNTINKLAPLNALNDDVWGLITKYCLIPKWHSGIKNYLLYNDPKNMGIDIGVTVAFGWDHGIRKISLEIDKDTTLDDLKRVWSWARKMFRNKTNTKFQPIKNFDRDKRIYNLDKEGKTIDEIGETVQTEFNQDLDYNHINLILSRYKKRIHTN